MKRLIAIVLSAMMLLSAIPTSLFAFALDGVSVGENVTAISTLPDGAADTLSATSPYAGTQLKTKFTGTDFQTRKENNLVSNIANTDVELKVTLNGSNLITDPTATSTSVPSLYDGIIDNGAQCTPHLYSLRSLNGTDPQGYLTLKLDAKYNISNIYLMSYFGGNFAIRAYEVYVSSDKDSLYDSGNLVATYAYDGYAAGSATTGKLNNTGISEGQEFIFSGDTVPAGSYVGFKFKDGVAHATYPYYFYVCELGVEGTEYKEPIGGNGNVTSVSSLPDGAASLITADSKYKGTQLITEFAGDAFQNRTSDNLIAKATDVKFYGAKATMINNSSSNKSQLYNGVIDNSNDKNANGHDANGEVTPKYGGSSLLSSGLNAYTDNPQAYLVAKLNDTYAISNIYLMGSNNGVFAHNNYEIYVANSETDLFNEDNKVVKFNYTGYDYAYGGSNGGPDNQGEMNADAVSEGQEYIFGGTDLPKGSYIGVKFITYSTCSSVGGSNWAWCSITEFGVEGTEYIDPYAVEYLSATTTQKEKLTVETKYPFTSLETVFTSKDVAAMKDNNLFAGMTKSRMTWTDGLGNSINFSDDAGTNGTLGLADGLICEPSDSDNWARPSNHLYYFGHNLNNNDKLATDEDDTTTKVETEYDYKLTFDMGKTYDFSSFYMFGNSQNTFAFRAYEVYISKTSDNIFDESNLVVTFDYSGYTSNTGGLNTDYISEGQKFYFNGDVTPKGQYIGVKYLTPTNSTSDNPHWFGLFEIGAEGVEYIEPYNIKYLSATSEEQANLTVESKYDFTNVETVFDKDAFADRTAKNLLKDLPFRNFKLQSGTNKAAGVVSSIYNVSEVGSSEGQATVKAFSDGALVYGGAYAHGNIIHFYQYGSNDYSEYYELSVDLGKTYDISDMYIMFGNSGNYATYKYDMYVSDNKDTLFDEANRVIAYNYDGYAKDGVTTGKLNHNYTNTSTMTSEGQEYIFTDDMPSGRYVGFKQYEGSKQRGGFLLISEFGVEGRIPFGLDESKLNDNVFIEPVNPVYADTTDSYSFTVDVKNGGKVEAVSVDGNVLTAVDGVYTVENPTSDMVIEVSTDRDEYSPTNGIWNGYNLNTKTTAYDTTIWDDVQVFETTTFYEGDTFAEISTRREAKMLYPIDEIIAVQSYDLKETYYEGEDFNIVDGKIVLTENTSIPVYGTEDGQTLEDMAVLQDNGLIDWSSNKGGFSYWTKIFWQYQICVTYTHSEVWSEDDLYINAPESKLSKIDKFHEKASSGEETNVLFIGDSITVGHNASAMNNTAAYKCLDLDGNGSYESVSDAPTSETNYGMFNSLYTKAQVDEWGATYWVNQVIAGLQDKYGDNIVGTNRGVSSTASAWAKTHMEFLYGEESGTPVPDLVVISYGTNEQSESVETFMSNLEAVIEYLRSRNPDCCFLFVSPFYCNRRELDGTLTSFNIGLHEDAFMAVENGTSELFENCENIIVAPNYSYFESFHNNKSLFDYLSDCTNHPNDFGSNVYAQNVLYTLGVVDDCTHAETYIKGAVDATCEETGYTGDKVCTVCGHIVEAGAEISALGHNWQVDKDREVKYCANECGTEEIPVYIVTFYGRDNKIIYEAVLEVSDDIAYLSDADVTAANKAAPYIYGYKFTGWDDEVNTEAIFEGSTSINALYERDTTKHNTTLKDSNGKVIDSQEIEFDQRFTVKDDSATAFLVDGQVVGGKGSVTLYGCGELSIEASTTVEANELTVSILKTVTEVVNEKNVYRVFVHVYNPAEVEVSKLGVMFAPGSAYSNDASFTMEALAEDKFITLNAEIPTNDLLATFNGITTSNQVTRVVRAYAEINGSNVYSGMVDKHTFN